jgi:hypothetical protein
MNKASFGRYSYLIFACPLRQVSGAGVYTGIKFPRDSA